MMPGLAYTISYEGADGSAHWEGRAVSDATAFRAYVCGTVVNRIQDAEAEEPFEAELRALATTGMASEFLKRFLGARPKPEAWEIGEALAECVLAQDAELQVCWPWNSVRDRRTPRASLPGADLVGFCRVAGGALLLLGEVKTSSDASTPPNVMLGKGGMAWQLEENATRLDIQHAILRWLRARCGSSEHQDLYRAAVQKYLVSRGKELLLVGVLIRDTPPDERDLRGRAATLSAKLPAPTRIEVFGWYLPAPISQWPVLLRGDEP